MSAVPSSAQPRPPRGSTTDTRNVIAHIIYSKASTSRTWSSSSRPAQPEASMLGTLPNCAACCSPSAQQKRRRNDRTKLSPPPTAKRSPRSMASMGILKLAIGVRVPGHGGRERRFGRRPLDKDRPMDLFDPPHPGEIIRQDYLIPLGVTRKTLSELLNGHSGASPEMAIRLEMPAGPQLPFGFACKWNTTCGTPDCTRPA